MGGEGDIIVCVGCPLGCEITVTMTESEARFEGNACREGRDYALEEYKKPVRVLTATVLTESSNQPLLSVKTNQQILKTRLKQAMVELAKVRVTPPVKTGDVILSNLSGTAVDVVATETLES